MLFSFVWMLLLQSQLQSLLNVVYCSSFDEDVVEHDHRRQLQSLTLRCGDCWCISDGTCPTDTTGITEFSIEDQRDPLYLKFDLDNPREDFLMLSSSDGTSECYPFADAVGPQDYPESQAVQCSKPTASGTDIVCGYLYDTSSSECVQRSYNIYTFETAEEATSSGAEVVHQGGMFSFLRLYSCTANIIVEFFAVAVVVVVPTRKNLQSLDLFLFLLDSETLSLILRLCLLHFSVHPPTGLLFLRPTTHGRSTACGVCSSAQDFGARIKTYETFDDELRLCAEEYSSSRDFFGLVSCISVFGFSGDCSTLWAHFMATTVALCADDCIQFVGSPNGPPPSCTPSDCLTCQSSFKADFDAIAGFEFTRAGITDEVAQPCSSFYRVVHDPCAGFEPGSPGSPPTSAPQPGDPSGSSTNGLSVGRTSLALMALIGASTYMTAQA
jgi:hypothetical protein